MPSWVQGIQGASLLWFLFRGHTTGLLEAQLMQGKAEFTLKLIFTLKLDAAHNLLVEMVARNFLWKFAKPKFG